jgi:hypothetical protein
MKTFTDVETFIFMLITFFVGMTAALLIVIIFWIEPMQGEAIKRGYAEWEIVNKNTGTTKFNWK